MLQAHGKASAMQCVSCMNTILEHLAKSNTSENHSFFDKNTKLTITL